MREKFKSIGGIRSPSIKSYVVAAFLVLLSSLIVTFWVGHNAQQNLKQDIQTSLTSGLKGASDLVANSVSGYSEALTHTAGLFLAMENGVTKEAWQKYTTNLNTKARYPGIQAIVYTEAVSKKDLQEYSQARRLDTRPDYSVTPAGDRDIYYPVRFIQPDTPKNIALTGLDVSNETVRGQTMMWARDTGKVSITSRLVLVSDETNNQSQPGFIIYVPVYSANAPINTVGERRAAHIGFVSAGIRSHELIEGLFGRLLTKDTAIRVYDGQEEKKQNLIFESKGYKDLIKQDNITRDQTVINLGNNKWTMVAYVNNNVATKAQLNQPRLILWSGLIFSIMLSGILLILMITRARSIAAEKGKEVQEAKDSLISLASHQLRTPATSVKQFIGMVLEGYAGKVSAEQKRMLHKAYASNERQLEIINQILHVTRADSGRLVLKKEKLDLTKLIRSVIAEHSQQVLARDQKVIFRQPKSVFIQADPHYLAMALDNLLSNASKYSMPKTTIRINLRVEPGQVVIAIADKGTGIAEDDMHRLFQKFSRIENDLSIEAGGNGIGLYLCQQIVQLHDGSIDVQSTVGEGSTFSITLPKR